MNTGFLSLGQPVKLSFVYSFVLVALQCLIKFILSMKQEAKFSFGKDPKQMKIPQQKVDQAKGKLAFQLKSQYYLQLPNKDYLGIVMLCLIAKTAYLTKKLNAAVNKLGKGMWEQITKFYLAHNQATTSFFGPYQLEEFANTTNYHFNLFQASHKLFPHTQILHPVNLFKKERNVILDYYALPENRPWGDKLKLEHPEEAIYIFQSGNDLIIAAFSSKELPARRLDRDSSGDRVRKQSQKTETQEILQAGSQQKPKQNKKDSKKQQEKKPQVEQLQEQFNQQQVFDPELFKTDEKKIHLPFTILLVLILILLIYFSFEDLPPSFYEGVKPTHTPILDYMVKGIDALINLFSSNP